MMCWILFGHAFNLACAAPELNVFSLDAPQAKSTLPGVSLCILQLGGRLCEVERRLLAQRAVLLWHQCEGHTEVCLTSSVYNPFTPKYIPPTFLKRNV